MAGGWSYQAGVCNIGPAEVHKRARAGWGMLAAAVAFAVVLGVLGAGRAWRAFVLLPLLLSAIGFVQARAKT